VSDMQHLGFVGGFSAPASDYFSKGKGGLGTDHRAGEDARLVRRAV